MKTLTYVFAMLFKISWLLIWISTYTVCVYHVTNKLLLAPANKVNMKQHFVSLPFLMKHGEVYTFTNPYRLFFFYRILIYVLVSSNTSMNWLLNAILPLADVLSKWNIDNSFVECLKILNHLSISGKNSR